MVIVVCVLLACVTVLGAVRMLRPSATAPIDEEWVKARQFSLAEVKQFLASLAPPPSGPSVLDSRLLEQVVVTLKNGTTFTGVLYVEDSGAVVLCNAQRVQRDGTRSAADGEIIILRADIDYIQRP